jgi:hypothetical protein
MNVPASTFKARQLIERAVLARQADDVHEWSRIVHVRMVHICAQLQHPIQIHIYGQQAAPQVEFFFLYL